MRKRTRPWWLLAAFLTVFGAGAHADELDDEVVDAGTGTRAYVISMTRNEVKGFYKILKKMETKYEHTGKHSNANKVDSRIKTKLRKQSITNVDDAYTEAWNCELQLTSTIVLGGARTKVIGAAGEANVTQTDGVNGANYQAIQELSIDWDHDTKELIITVLHPASETSSGSSLKNKAELVGVFTTIGKSKFSKTAINSDTTLTADFAADDVEGENGGQDMAEGASVGFTAKGKKVLSNIVVDLIVDGSPYKFVRGALYLERKVFNGKVSSVQIGFGVDWDPDALLKYEEEYVRVGTATCTYDHTERANLKFTDKLFHIDTFEEEISNCENEKVERIVAHLDWHARSAIGLSGGEALPGIRSRIEFEVSGLNAAAGKLATTLVRTVWHSKLDWRLDVLEIPSAFGVASRTAIEGSKNFLKKEFALE